MFFVSQYALNRPAMFYTMIKRKDAIINQLRFVAGEFGMISCRKRAEIEGIDFEINKLRCFDGPQYQ